MIIRQGVETVPLMLLIPLLLALAVLMIPFSSPSAEEMITRVIIRVISRDAKVIGSNVGGAHVRIRSLETGKVLAEGKQEGGTGDTDAIMVQPRRRGEALYDTPGAAFFEAQMPLERPTRVEILTEAPLAYPHALQRGSKTLTLIPGKHILGEGVVIELNGLIVNLLQPAPSRALRKGKEVSVKVEIKML